MVSLHEALLFTAESKPAGDAALGLGGLPLDRAVEVVDLLERLGLGLLCLRFGFTLGFGELALGGCHLYQGMSDSISRHMIC